MWSAQQQSMLNAMGYILYVRPGSLQVVSQLDASSTTVDTAKKPSELALFKAVMKAAQGKDISPLAVDFDALRSSPQTKRALWLQLRRVIKS